ncbi:hypothetical protein [Bythopirellula goksoeyrii]|uniref:Uncharacterized protein n=1 Tax=Bythopirellula goksoeyrii TaxID=1400387 RepID=A0A5B9QBY0_9BACT|nr:hypothetical protein [Bythopirellula goksoeyrii]QEG36524.1 hypothetical protein Pr1d_38380 [Bythopirellula goksoeyrii]
MNNSQDKQLDQLLVDWANVNVADNADLTDLQRKICDRLAVEELQSSVEPGTLQSTPNPSRRPVATAMAIAAMLLVAVGFWTLVVDRKGENAKQVAHSVQESSFSNDIVSLDHQIELLKEFRTLFGTELAWISEEGKTVEVGLRAVDSTSSSPATEYVAVQLTLWSRPVSNDKGDQNWSQLESFNVLAEREQLVQVIPQRGTGSPLLLWAYPLDNSLVSIDLEYRSGVVRGLSIDSSNLQPIGEQHSMNIHSFEKDGVEYRLYQTADLVDAADLG